MRRLVIFVIALATAGAMSCYWPTSAGRTGSAGDLLSAATGARAAEVVATPAPEPDVIGSGLAPRAATDFAVLQGFRWNPCATIPVYLHRGDAPASVGRMVRQALDQARAATGLTFSLEGSTRTVPFSRSWNRRVPTDGLYVGFSTKRDVPALKGAVAGLGGPGILERNSAGQGVIASGGAVIDTDEWGRLRPGFIRGLSRGSLLLHELGHAIGLEHASAKGEVMFPYLNRRSPGTYAPGDLAGLERLGADHGCL